LGFYQSAQAFTGNIMVIGDEYFHLLELLNMSMEHFIRYRSGGRPFF
jgi:hypothetical protein